MKNQLILGLGLILLSLASIQAQTTRTVSDFTIVNSFTRKTQYYTQGLQFLNKDTLVESTGLYKQSKIQHVSLSTQTVLKTKSIGSTYFGEGCQLHNVSGVQRIYQLTWKERKVLVWKASDLSLIKTITIPTAIKEGWGITKGAYTSSINAFYVSDGSSNLYVVDLSTWKVLKTVSVKKRSGTRISMLNELEWVNGKIWANIYMTNTIAIIDPVTGYVDTIVDLTRLHTLAKAKAQEMGITLSSGYVLNGIAYDSANDRLIVTGKRWPLMWEIKVNGI
jgi:glutamine cyclotransferase